MRIKLGMPMSLGEISVAVGGSCDLRLKSGIVNFITTDTRELLRGDLYIAIKGSRYDGEEFSKTAEEMGASVLSTKKGAKYITVEDTNAALLRLASYYKAYLIALRETVGVTGSVGKSTTKEFLSAICGQHRKVFKSYGNFNNNIGLPLSILSADRASEIMVLEMGMNAPGEIRTLAACATPDIAVITNIGSSHIGNLGSRENIAKAKLEITSEESVNHVIVPKAEPLLASCVKRHTFSETDTSADTAVIGNGDGTVRVYFDGAYAFSSKFRPIGKHFISCLAAAVASARLANIPLEAIKIGISHISDNNIRQKLIPVKSFYVLDDSYNASYESIAADLALIRSEIGYTARSALLGSVLELGKHSTKIHYEIGALAARTGLDRLYLFGEYSLDMADGAESAGMSPERIFINSDPSLPEITAEQILKHTVQGEIILFKASNAIRLSRVLDLVNN